MSSAFLGMITSELLLWVELCPPIIHVLKSQTLVSQNMTLFGNKVIVVGIHEDEVIRVVPNPVWLVFL